MTDMRRGIIIAAAMTVLVVAVIIMTKDWPAQVREITFSSSGNMRILSPDFESNTLIPSRYSCDGEDINPKIVISGVPEKAASLALIIDDPDASVGNWVHWVVWNIAPGLTEIAAGSVPPGSIQGVTSFGKSGYGGPCPPSGEHRYFFKMYALDEMLDLPEEATASELETAMEGHVLDKAGLIGVYGR
jgi:hypothetical protein